MPAIARGILVPLLLGSLSGVVCPVQAGLEAPQEHISRHRLGNGMDVLLLQIPDAPMVGMNVQVKAGSAWENFRTSGMSHMLEHLLFNGTERYTQREFYDAADRIGAYNNANTSRFYTNFMMLVPTEDMDAGMELQSQMLFHSLLPPAKFEKERGIVLEELAQGGDDAQQKLEESWEDFLYAGTSFDLPTLGTPSTIRSMSRDEVWAYYKGHYQPNNMLLSVVGGFSKEDALAAIETHYGSVAAGELPELDLKGITWSQKRTRSVRGNLQAPRLRMAWQAPDMSHPQHLAAELLAWNLGDPRDGVLPLLLFQAGLPPVEGLSVHYIAEPGFGRFELEAILPPGLHPDSLVNGLQNALSHLKDYPFQESLVRQRILDERTAFAQLMEKPHYFGLMQAGSFVHQGFDESLLRKERLAELDTDDLRRCASDWLTSTPPLQMALYPESGQHREQAEVSERDRIEQREPGQPILLIDGSRPSEVFALQAIIKGRSVWEGPERAGAINLIHHLMKEGAAGQSASQLKERIRRIGAKLTLYDNPAIPYDNHYTSSSHSFLRLECLGEHWQAACSLATDLLYHTELNSQSFERVRTRQIEQLTGKQASARSRSRELLDARLYDKHPSALPPAGSIASLMSLDLSDLEALQGAAFRPANTILSVTGPAPAAEIRDMLEQLTVESNTGLSESSAEWLRQHSPWLKDCEPGAPVLTELPPLALTTEDETIQESLNGEMHALRLASRIKINEEDGPALRLLFSLLSDKLSFDLREERGWAYSIGCWASVQENRATLEAYMGTRPENSEAALKALREWLQGKKLSKITQEELDQVRGGLMGRRLMRGLASINQSWQRAIGELGGNPDAFEKSNQALRAVTLDDLQRVRKHYLKDLPWITVVVD